MKITVLDYANVIMETKIEATNRITEYFSKTDTRHGYLVTVKFRTHFVV